MEAEAARAAELPAEEEQQASRGTCKGDCGGGWEAGPLMTPHGAWSGAVYLTSCQLTSHLACECGCRSRWKRRWMPLWPTMPTLRCVAQRGHRRWCRALSGNMQKAIPIADGSYGHVYEGRYNGLSLAIKLFKSEPEEAAKEAVLEAEVYERRKALKVYPAFLAAGRDLDGRPFALITERMNLADLESVAWERGADGKLVLAGAAFFHTMGGVALCTLRMAGEGYVHRDIKPANILVTRISDSAGSALDVRFADPGCSQRADQPLREVEAWRRSGDPLALQRGIEKHDYLGNRYCQVWEVHARQQLHPSSDLPGLCATYMDIIFGVGMGAFPKPLHQLGAALLAEVARGKLLLTPEAIEQGFNPACPMSMLSLRMLLSTQGLMLATDPALWPSPAHAAHLLAGVFDVMILIQKREDAFTVQLACLQALCIFADEGVARIMPLPLRQFWAAKYGELLAVYSGTIALGDATREVAAPTLTLRQSLPIPMPGIMSSEHYTQSLLSAECPLPDPDTLLYCGPGFFTDGVPLLSILSHMVSFWQALKSFDTNPIDLACELAAGLPDAEAPYLALKLPQLQAAARRVGRGAAQGGDREAADRLAALQAAAKAAERPEWQTPACAPPLQAAGEVLTSVAPKALSYALGGEYHSRAVGKVPLKAGDFLLDYLLPALQLQIPVLRAASDDLWLLAAALGTARGLRATAPALLELHCQLETSEDDSLINSLTTVAAIHCLEGQVQLAAKQAFKRPGPGMPTQQQRDAQVAFVEQSSMAAVCIFLEETRRHRHDWTSSALLVHWVMAARLGGEAAIGAHLLGHSGNLSLPAAAAGMAVQAAAAASAVRQVPAGLQAGAGAAAAAEASALAGGAGLPGPPLDQVPPHQQQVGWQQVGQAAEQQAPSREQGRALEEQQQVQQAQQDHQPRLSPEAAQQLASTCPLQGLGVVAMAEAAALHSDVAQAHVTATHGCAMLAVEGAARASRLAMPGTAAAASRQAAVPPAAPAAAVAAATTSQQDVVPAPEAFAEPAAAACAPTSAGVAGATAPAVQAPLAAAPCSEEQAQQVRSCVLRSSRLLSSMRRGGEGSGGDSASSSGSGGLPTQPQPLCLLDFISMRLQALSFNKPQAVEAVPAGQAGKPAKASCPSRKRWLAEALEPAAAAVPAVLPTGLLVPQGMLPAGVLVPPALLAGPVQRRSSRRAASACKAALQASQALSGRELEVADVVERVRTSKLKPPYQRMVRLVKYSGQAMKGQMLPRILCMGVDGFGDMRIGQTVFQDELVEGHSRVMTEVLEQLNCGPRSVQLRQRLSQSQGAELGDVQLKEEHIEVSLDFLAPGKAALAMPTVLLRPRFDGDDLDEVSALRAGYAADGAPSSAAGGGRTKYACCDGLLSLPEAEAKLAIEEAVQWIGGLQGGRAPVLQQGGEVDVRFRLDKEGSFAHASSQWFTMRVVLPPRPSKGTPAAVSKNENKTLN
ncbi:hypothetical protein ABPG75_011664 [Micractinium tetrahymenae]